MSRNEERVMANLLYISAKRGCRHSGGQDAGCRENMYLACWIKGLDNLIGLRLTWKYQDKRGGLLGRW